jgi:glycosyltransferase involved in cell wall biosynthesis
MNELIHSPKMRSLGRKIVYLIIGDGDERESLEKLSSDLDLNQNVFFLGHIDRAAEYMKAFDITVIPSRSEGLCYVAMESGLATVPVVASGVGGITEVIEDMKSGILIQPEKPKELYHSIEFLITHPSVDKEYAKALNERIKKEFSVDKMVKETIQIYCPTNSFDDNSL